MPKRVMMFALWFPPVGGSSVQRALKFVKYLPAHGFEPIVVAATPQPHAPRDPTLTGEIPRTATILQARTLPLQRAAWGIDRALARLDAYPRLYDALWPDDQVGSLPAALALGLRAARRHRPDVIFSTSWPLTAHLAAMILHRLTGIPWVADFRDSETLNPSVRQEYSYSPLTHARAALEQRIAEDAAYTTVACETVQVLGMRPDDPRRVVVSNGVDPDDLALDVPVDGRAFRLSHVGSLSHSRDLGPVLAVVREMAERGELDPARFELRLVGQLRVRNEALNGPPVTTTGYVGHLRAIEEMAGASALLLYQSRAELTAPGKLYEYLACERPVLCVTHPDNVGARLVRELGAGWFADVRDPTEIRRVLSEVLALSERGPLPETGAREEVLRRFSRRALAGELADVLRAAIAERRRH